MMASIRSWPHTPLVVSNKKSGAPSDAGVLLNRYWTLRTSSGRFPVVPGFNLPTGAVMLSMIDLLHLSWCTLAVRLFALARGLAVMRSRYARARATAVLLGT